jgi:hypothetical protein
VTDFTIRGGKWKDKSSTWCKVCASKTTNEFRETPHGRFMNAKGHARRKKYSWSLTEAQYADLAFQNCHYCDQSTGRVGTGLDQMIAGSGYHTHNVVPCCCRCNRMKGDHWSYAEFIQFSSMIKELDRRRKQTGKAAA